MGGKFRASSWCPLPGGVLPYMGYIGMCRCEGYGFQAVYSSIGYINQSVWPRIEYHFSETKENRNCYSKIYENEIGKFKFSRLSLNSVHR